MTYFNPKIYCYANLNDNDKYIVREKLYTILGSSIETEDFEDELFEYDGPKNNSSEQIAEMLENVMDLGTIAGAIELRFFQIIDVIEWIVGVMDDEDDYPTVEPLKESDGHFYGLEEDDEELYDALGIALERYEGLEKENMFS